ncbi:uncharacterized protein F4812DRAFT_418415 [Daldinia caldariorum]|uniref:uncharacterized protein n=1 Tax=Daldinia caldariorum TaxID=326644 RepID=UPI002008728F|nr:uncharacterized protein F4812DRAFT_418415 [Daldinia caldariorum]KAI1470633.1 hypothetical protein F4812DRAFT_418415 [Daldinia caldariorum]
MATDWNKLKVVDLKSELKRLGLPQNGLKADLVARLEAVDSERAASQSSGETPEETEAVNGEVQPVEIPPEATEAPEYSHATPPDESSKQSEVAAEAEAEATAIPGQEVSAPVLTETQELAPSTGDTLLHPTELIQDSQKRKRRSLSPAPSGEEVARKRARQDNRDAQEDPVVATPVGEKADAVAELQEDKEDTTRAPPDVEMEDTKDEAPVERERERDNGVTQPILADDANPDLQNGHAVEVVTNKTQATFQEPPEDEPSREQTYTAHPAEIERDVEPSIHPATSALYIKNFMRPLRPQAVKEHLLDLAASIGAPAEEGTIVDFYLDTIRTHAFVVFNTISSASRVRTALHNRVWPDETNRKALWVDFIPSERFAEWVDMEQTSTGGRGSTHRYEVVYDNDEDGNVIVKLEEFDGAGPTKQAPPAPEPQLERKPSIPTGPSRQFSGIEGAPTGPRGFNSNHGPGMHQTRAGILDQPGQSTHAHPIVRYQPVSDDLVRRRLDAIAAAKTKDTDRDFGKDYKRYYFENGDTLVDRGKEIFLGIRPPHREHQREREQRHETGREPAREPGRSRRAGGGGGGGRRRGGMPIFHGVPRGGDRFRPGESGSSGRSRYSDDRSSRRDGYGRYADERPSRRDSYNRY